MLENPPPKAVLTDAEIGRQIARLTRRSFAVGATVALAGFGGWTWLRKCELEDDIPWPLRRVLRFNERLSQAYFQDSRLAPTFPVARAAEPRPNGGHGLAENVDPVQWRLRVENPAAKIPAFALSLADIKALPRVEMVTKLKCIEGWSQVVQWAGVRLADLATTYRLGTHSGAAPDPKQKPKDLVDYVSLTTIDGTYYVGLDRQSAFHPQTLLCYEMNGEPLTESHGAPLRLVIPLKYGIKSIKWLGTIRFTDERPADYWAERGYDWYAGH
jgi:DMSO/TMAO reductase YedYZ molybdopterin-dependent catalytic subunit